MGIDYTAFLKARVQADPNEAKKPDQQEDDIFGLNNEEIKKEEPKPVVVEPVPEPVVKK